MPPLHLLVLARAEERRDGAAERAARAPGTSAVGRGRRAGRRGSDRAPRDSTRWCWIWAGPSSSWPGCGRRWPLPRAGEPDSLEAAERRHIALMLRYTEGNRRRAAQLLGISRSTLLHKVRKYGLDAG